jgi:D-alanyl-D-alanine carboxypeptidase
MKKILTIAILSFSVFGLKAQSFNPLLASMLQDTLNTYVSQITNIKGMSASVYIPGQGIWTGVSGNSYAGQPITSDMRFGIASNSKLFCSVMMLKLTENNIISLEDSLKDWITISNPNINPNITIRQLLNHTSGLSDPFFEAPWMDTILANPTRVFTPNEVLGWIGAPLFAAGTSWGYSNTNYVLAGMVAENASGFSLSTLIRDSILTPLNMDSTFIDVQEPVNGILAHRWWNRVVNPVTEDYHDTSRVGLNSAVGYAGSIFSTSSEMVQWYNALFNGQLINQSSMNELTTFIATSNPNYQYGLGLSRDVTQGIRYWGHGGRTWGYKSKILYDTCLHVSVAGLSNSDPSGMDAVAFLLYRAVKNHIPGCSDAITGPIAVCEGTNSLTYTVPPIPNATSYSWTLPSGVTGTSATNSITINFGIGANSGNIKVTGINNYGPGGSSSVWVTVNPIPATPLISISGKTLTSNAPSGNQWYNSSGIIVGAINTTYTITASDKYYCIVTLLGCSSDTSNNINAEMTTVNEIYLQNNLKIYPNPGSSNITFQTNSQLNNATLVLTDCSGRTVVKIENISGHLFILHRTNLDSGLYFVQLIEDNRVITMNKIVIAD